MENGIMQCDPNFVSKVSSYPNFENYLFSNWMLPYFFNDYIENGFNSTTFEVPHLLDATKISNSTVKNSLYYLQAVTKRHQREWDKYANLINNINAVDEWEYCGVFENLNSSGIEMPYDPEEIVSTGIVFDAQSKGDAMWYKPGANKEVYNFFTNHSEYGSGVHYAQTFIYSPTNQRIHLKLGKGGLIRLWLNDVLILESDNEYITELDAYTYAVNLQKGVNRILVKSATSGETPYFIMRLEDLNGNSNKNYNVSFKDRNYIKGNIDSVNPILIPHSVETYFEKKLEDNNSDINLSRYCLYLSYFRNGRLNEAIELLNSWAEQFPKSSLIKTCLIECYTAMDDNNTLKKLQNNIKRLDPDYYLSLMLEFQNLDELMKLDIQKYESKLKKIGNSVDYPFIKTTSDLLIFLRQNDRVKMQQKLDVLMNDKTLPSTIKPTFSEFYSSVFNDDNETIKTLERINKFEYNWQSIKTLAKYYRKQNRIEDAIQLYINSIEKFGDDNNVIYKLISLLHDTGQYQRSLSYIEKTLENYPNSYLFTKLKGDTYVQLNKKDEAIKLYETALRRSPSDNELRTKINDLRKNTNPLNDFHVDDAYNYINENRNTITKNNYGLNTLLNQTDILGYKNGGGEYKATLIYEITSQNGIDIFKEYSLGLSGDYIIKKSEIVKPNGDTVPADRNGSDLVFDELEIGDVIYIDYDARYTRNGRFYKDYILSHSFNGYHPTIKNVYRFLTHDKKVNHIVTNGTVDYKNYKTGELYIHEWSLNNISGIPISEDYMPTFTDVTTKLHISSIDSWDEIATWYSDIVRKQLKFDYIVEEAFNSIFPNGYEQLSEEERAKRIYYYITNNMNYSYVNFRQGGYVPQKPSKTIKTRLGDCKDFSSLFLILAQQAKLDTRMVLILTSDYGENELVLPSSDFNHCIVKVKIDGMDQFLELTDKYLPFKSLPMSLRDAAALEIPFDSSEKFTSGLMHLKKALREPAKFKSNYVMDLGQDFSKIDLTSTISGHLASYYIDIFENKKDKLLKETLQEEISNRSSEVIKLVDIKAINHAKNEDIIKFKTELTTELAVNKIGDLFSFKIPFFLNPYNNSIIQNENRSYPIDYKQYENSDFYNESILIRLKENQKI
ncbi:MAG: tetratricopeptide repeat protein, partial [Flavobacteriaceae bacterium]|nr:tetratricopeptide repeat protein [Flavobacteriaceae bacterium]